MVVYVWGGVWGCVCVCVCVCNRSKWVDAFGGQLSLVDVGVNEI